MASNFTNGYSLAGQHCLPIPHRRLSYTNRTSSRTLSLPSLQMFFPGNRAAGTNTVTGAQWLRIGEQGAYGAPGPAGRMGHIAGAIGDQLFVYGACMGRRARAE